MIQQRTRAWSILILLGATDLLMSCASADDGTGATRSLSQELPLRPTGLAPAGTTGSDPLYRWSAAPGVSRYRLWVNDASSPRVIDQTFLATDAGCPSGTEPECSFAPSHALAPGYGRWWVQGIDATGAGPWSPGVDFFVTSRASLIAPASLTDVSPTYQWNSVAGSSSYTLWVDDGMARPKISQTITPDQAHCASGGICSFTPFEALQPGDAKWWVRAGTGLWSPPLAFHVMPEPCGIRSVRMVEVHPGSWLQYVKLRNTHPSCDVNLAGFQVFSNYDWHVPVTFNYSLAPGAEVYVSGGTDIDIDAPRIIGGPALFQWMPPAEMFAGLCVGICTPGDSSNVIDAVTLALDTDLYPIQTSEIPYGVTFAPAPLTEPRANDAVSFHRVAFTGSSPVFATSDWAQGPATADICVEGSDLEFRSCNEFAGRVCLNGGLPGCRCRHVNDPNADRYIWDCMP